MSFILMLSGYSIERPDEYVSSVYGALCPTFSVMDSRAKLESRAVGAYVYHM